MSGPTPASAWKTPATPTTTTLPSGNVAVLRERVSVYDLVRAGADDDVIAAIDQMQAGELKDQRLAVKLQDAICEAMFITPKIGSDDGNLPLSALSDEDVDYVVVKAFGGAPDASFRDERDGDRPGADSKAVLDEPVSDARPAKRQSRGAGNGSASRKKAAARRADADAGAPAVA